MLYVNNIDVYYGDVQVLKGISLYINKGEIISLIGSNAAGKTTIINTVTGILKPKSGEIVFKDERLDKVVTHDVVDKGIVQVLEGRLLFPYMTVYENLLMGAHTKRARKKVEESLKFIYHLLPILEERKKETDGWYLKWRSAIDACYCPGPYGRSETSGFR